MLVLHPSCFQHIRASENTRAAEAKSLLITFVPHLLHASFPTCGKGLALPGPQTGLSHVERMKCMTCFCVCTQVKLVTYLLPYYLLIKARFTLLLNKHSSAVAWMCQTFFHSVVWVRNNVRVKGVKLKTFQVSPSIPCTPLSGAALCFVILFLIMLPTTHLFQKQGCLPDTQNIDVKTRFSLMGLLPKNF